MIAVMWLACFTSPSLHDIPIGKTFKVITVHDIDDGLVIRLIERYKYRFHIVAFL